MMQNNTADNGSREKKLLSFRYSYIIIPCLLALVCIIVAIVFYSRLPVEMGLRFSSDGTPKTVMSKAAFLSLMLGLQAGIACVTVLITAMFLKAARIMSRNSAVPANLPGFILIFSNLPLLPQLILAYLMIDSFIYGMNDRHVISLGAFSLWIVGIGTVVLSVLFVRLMLQLRAKTVKQ